MLALAAGIRFAAVAWLLLGALRPIAGQEHSEPRLDAHRLIDRIVAAVDDDPIYLSDVRRAIAFDETLRDAAGPDGVSARRRALDRLIEQRLRLHEVDRSEIPPPTRDQLDEQLEALRARYPSDAAWHNQLDDLALDEDGLRLLVARQLRVLRYIEERLRPRVFIELEEIERYYEEELPGELDVQGVPLPPLEQVRDAIRRLLRERRLDQEIREWTDELRAKAEVVDLLDRRETSLPPIAQE